MQRLNDAPIVDQTEGQRETLLMIALWKLSSGNPVKIDGPTIRAFNEAHPGGPVMFMHGHPESIEVSVIDHGRAAFIAAHQSAITSKAEH